MISRREIYQSIFGTNALFIAGLLMMPALLFNPSTELRVFQFLLFCMLAWFSGKKTNPLMTICVIAGIVAFNLIIPYGRVVFTISFFQITSGALEAGIHRAVTFQGLVMLSRFCVREDLKIPGVFGELLGESLRIFSAMMNREFRLTGKNIIAEIDSLLLELSAENVSSYTERRQKTKPAGYIILGVVVIIAWLLCQTRLLCLPFGMLSL